MRIQLFFLVEENGTGEEAMATAWTEINVCELPTKSRPACDARLGKANRRMNRAMVVMVMTMMMISELRL